MDGGAAGLGVRVRHWFAGWGFKQWRQAALVTVLAGTALFGGLDTVNKAVTIVKPGEEYKAGLVTVTVQRASLVPEVVGAGRVLYPAKPGRRYLGVVMTIKNNGTVPTTFDFLVDLRDQPDSRRLGASRMIDGSHVGRFGAGLTDDLVLMWELPESALSVGDTITLRIWNQQITEYKVSYGTGWVTSQTDYGQVTVPVGGPK